MQSIEERHVVIPVRIFGEKIVFLYGDSVPEIEKGAFADLIIDRAMLINEEDVKKLNEKRKVPFLNKNHMLRAYMTLELPAVTDGLVKAGNNMEGLGEGTSCAPIKLEEVQFLLMRGSKTPRLMGGRCYLPTLKKSVESLNEAYTELSTHYEPWRKSHTGNVFRRIYYYDEQLKTWFSLGHRRRMMFPLYEKRLSRKTNSLSAQPSETTLFDRS